MMPPGGIHSLLKRQLKKCFGNSFVVPGEWRAFLEMVDSAYRESDADRLMLERSLELSSQELLQANSEMRAVFETVPDLFFRVDFSGTILDCKTGNPSDLVVYRRNQVGCGICNFPLPAVAGRFREALETVRRTNAVVCFEYSLVIHGKENHYEARWIPLLGDQIIVVIRNISERKRAEEALLASERQYRTIFERTATANVIIAEDKTILMVNDNFVDLCGYAKEELEGKLNWPVFVHPDDLERINTYHRMRRIDSGSAPSSYEFRFVNRKGAVSDIFMTVGLLPETKHSIISLVNMTELKRLKSDLFQAQKLESVGRLAGGIAHDFNNMLGVIIGNAELALEEIDGDAPLGSLLQDILAAGRRSADLTSQLLGFARKQVVSPKVLDLNDTITGMLEMLRKFVGEQIALEWRPGPDLWRVKIDPSQVSQILANLTINARDAVGKAGRITIETSNAACDEAGCTGRPEWISGDHVLLTVNDDGCGMDKETLANIFEPFFTTKKEALGTGLGLATVYGIVGQNAGYIRVDSEPMRGSTFRVYLPRDIGGATRPEVDAPEAGPAGGTETILVVEDERSVLALTQAMLERLGYNVLAAGGKDDALRLAKDHVDDIDLLLTDVVMPDMDGKELSERILALRPGLKRLFMSGYSEDVIASQGVLEEGVQFVSKPFSMKGLSEKVRKALDGQPLPEGAPL